MLKAGLAARRLAADPGIDVAALREAIDNGSSAEAKGDIAAAVDWDLSFHAAVNALSGNPILAEVSEGQRPQIRRVMAVVKTDRSLATRIWLEHAAIADAIATGDAAAAETLARGHAARAGDETRRRLINKAQAADKN